MRFRSSRCPQHTGPALGLLTLLLAGAMPLAGQEPVKPMPLKTKGVITLARPRWGHAPKTLAAGMNARGELTPADRRLAVDNTPYEVWSYAGTEGEVLTVIMRSTKVDAYVMVVRQGPGGVETIAEDDDGLGGGTTDAGLRVRLPQDGEYQIVATATPTLGPKYFFGPYMLEILSSLGNPTPDWSALTGGSPNDRYAVVVGISDYPGRQQNLTGPRQDAAMFRDLLVRKYGFKEQNVVTLTDRNGSREQILAAFRRFLSRAGPGGTAVFYYSGYGTQLTQNLGVTGTADPEQDGRDEALYVWDSGSGEKGSVILDDELGVLAGELKAGRVLLVLDASYSGTGTRGLSGLPKLLVFDDLAGVQMPTGFVGKRGQRAEFPTGDVVLSAAADREVAWTASGWPSHGGFASVFTYYLVNAMQRADSSTTIEQMMAGVRDSTDAFAKANHGKTQTPQAEGAGIGELLSGFLGP
jgi:hypothetical protein